MRTLSKSVALSTLLFTGVGALSAAQPAVAADTNAPQQIAAAGATSLTLREVVVRPKSGEHYTVPAGYDSNVWLHPYTSGIGPCTEGASPSQGCHHDTGHPIPPSIYERVPFNQ